MGSCKLLSPSRKDKIRISFRIAILLAATVLLVGASVFAQVQTGTPPLGSFGGGPDILNLGNLNDHWTINVLHKPGRGLNFSFFLAYDSSTWSPVTTSGTTTWQPVAAWGWSSSAFRMGYARGTKPRTDPIWRQKVRREIRT